MNQTERFYKIEQLLTTRRVVSFEVLQDELEVSRATLKRDLTYLRDRLNSPIVYSRELGGYLFEEGVARQAMPGMWFNSSEAYALLMMQSLLKEIQPSVMQSHIEPLQARLSALIGTQNFVAESVAEKIQIITTAKRKAEPREFDVIASALLNNKRLVIQHWNRASNVTADREVSPQQMIYYRDNWYVVAYCHLRGEVRTFGLDAIKGATQVDTPAVAVSKAEIDAILKSGYGIFGGAKTETAKLHFNAKIARWVANETWHKDQKATVQADGSYILEVPYSNATEIVMDIMKYGANVEVLAPASLRVQVIAEMKAAISKYND